MGLHRLQPVRMTDHQLEAPVADVDPAELMQLAPFRQPKIQGAQVQILSARPSSSHQKKHGEVGRQCGGRPFCYASADADFRMARRASSPASGEPGAVTCGAEWLRA